jgi:hypothetical protein
MDSMMHGALALHLGVFAVMLPLFAVERSAIRNGTFFWNGFSQGKPNWVVPAIKLLGLFFAVHFVLFLVQSHAASPAIRNGEYVLNNHGEILRTLTRSEYFHLKSAELRIFASEWMFFYLVPATYWWFAGRHLQTARSDIREV